MGDRRRGGSGSVSTITEASPRKKIRIGIGNALLATFTFTFASLFSLTRLARQATVAATTKSSLPTDSHEADTSRKKALRAPPPPVSRQFPGETMGNGADKKHLPCVGPVPPNATAVASLLRSEHVRAGVTVRPDDWYDNYGVLYSMTYAFVSGFERRDIPIFLMGGSHLGALRHHGIIPFKEKDVDFAVFSLDVPRMKDIIDDILAEQGHSVKCRDVKPPANFGVNVVIPSLSHFFDFWFYDDNYQGKGKVKCVGPQNRGDADGCTKWYRHYQKMDPPAFAKRDWVPPARQVFGTHRVPVPATSAFLDGKQYNFEDWNITCGDHYSWLKRGTIPAEERRCAQYYAEHPFVFRVDGGRQELRQGGRVLHVSSLAAPCADRV